MKDTKKEREEGRSRVNEVKKGEVTMYRLPKSQVPSPNFLLATLITTTISYVTDCNRLLLQVRVEPLNCLRECRLLCNLLPALAQVAADSKSVVDVGKKVDLVRDVQLCQDLLRFVALLRCEDKVLD